MKGDLTLLTCFRCLTVLVNRDDDYNNNNDFRESRSSKLQPSQSSPAPFAKPKSQVTSLDWLVSEKRARYAPNNITIFVSITVQVLSRFR